MASFADEGRQVRIQLKSGRELSAGLVILSIGVRPNGALAKDAGLAVNQRGGIVVDSHMRTSDPAIYTVGDAVEVEDFVFGEPCMIPLAGPANKQGRIAADNIAGLNQRYAGSLGASVAKVFDLTAAAVGANEKALIHRGMARGRIMRLCSSARTATQATSGAEPMYLAAVLHRWAEDFRRADCGWSGVDKRIDTLSVAIRLGPVQQPGAGNELRTALFLRQGSGEYGGLHGQPAEGNARFAPGTRWTTRAMPRCWIYARIGSWRNTRRAIHIPLGELRARANELNRDKPVIVVCAAGVRAHTAARMLSNLGFAQASIYPGGIMYYLDTHD